MEEQLAGGVANGGAVTRVDGHVLRPGNPHSLAIHRLLRRLREVGFDEAPQPVGIEADGRERLEFIEGDVPLPPFPAWAQSDDALASTATLLRRLHDASRQIDPQDGAWSRELAQDGGGPVMCHNDPCLENFVFRNGKAIALLDFDFVAPGRPASDVARLLGYAVPLDDDTNARMAGWVLADVAPRVRLVADTYGLDTAERSEVLSWLDRRIAEGGRWVLSKVEAGDLNFAKMWAEGGGMERYDRRRRWWATNRDRVAAALT